MKATEIITVNPVSAEIINGFKDERLIEATQKIVSIYTSAARYANEKNREIAKILGTVATEKSYVADGFSSVAEYAHKLFNINRENAYALANAGKIYNNPDSPEVLRNMSHSKLAAIASLPEETVNKAIEDGTITADTTQAALKEFAANVKKETSEKDSSKVEIVKEYTIKTQYATISDILSTLVENSSLDSDEPGFVEITSGQAGEYLHTIATSHMTMAEWDDFFTAFFEHIEGTIPEMVKLPKGKVNPDSKKATVERKLYVSDDLSIVVRFFTYTAPKTNQALPKFTKEELLAMLSALEEQES